MIPRFFQVANCHLPFDGKQRPCLYYHIDQCLAPCAGKADPAEYAERVREARLFLEGRDEELHAVLRERMDTASRALAFERAARYRDMLRSLEKLNEKQGMSSVGLEAIDFWAEHREGDDVAVELFRMREGRVVGRREFTLENAPPPDQLYDSVLPQFYAAEEPPEEIVLPRSPAESTILKAFLRERRGGNVRLSAPHQGEKRRFLDLVAQNARLAFEARFRATHVHGVQALEELRDVLGLEEVRTGSRGSTSATCRAASRAPRWSSSRAAGPGRPTTGSSSRAACPPGTTTSSRCARSSAGATRGCSARGSASRTSC
jgi:excinuclease ABC subunit C